MDLTADEADESKAVPYNVASAGTGALLTLTNTFTPSPSEVTRRSFIALDEHNVAIMQRVYVTASTVYTPAG